MSSEILHSSLLYEAATNALAADASGENTWTKMVEHYRFIANTELFKVDIKNTEALIKEEYKLVSMPNAWRSAKSVVMGAIDKHIDLVDENAKIKGKTLVQNEIKAYKKEPEAPKDLVKEAIKLMYRTESYFNDAEPEQKTEIKDRWNMIGERINKC